MCVFTEHATLSTVNSLLLIELLLLKNFMAIISLTLREKFLKDCSAKSKLLGNNSV